MRQQGRVRWKRFALIFLPATAVATLLLCCATVWGAVNASFVIAGQDLKVTASVIRAWNVTEFGDPVETTNGTVPAYVTTARRAEIFDLCQSYLVNTPVGVATIKLTGGDLGEPVRAQNQVVFAKMITGYTMYTNFQVGRDASTLPTLSGVHGTPGAAGQYAAVVVVKDVRQIQLANSAESLIVPNSLARVLPGVHECF
ncbi:DUF6230 family protein [Sphaerisporangium corydalis]|uniref:DUF6230 family protein n=1 Tax=Sphaerisporangium corydalis TaxID=1441875 RepID=A0ABV9EH01_9ACTN|nr:DUF6230 family protein [Sphaerisporangium corydalis]